MLWWGKSSGMLCRARFALACEIFIVFVSFRFVYVVTEESEDMEMPFSQYLPYFSRIWRTIGPPVRLNDRSDLTGNVNSDWADFSAKCSNASWAYPEKIVYWCITRFKINNNVYICILGHDSQLKLYTKEYLEHSMINQVSTSVFAVSCENKSQPIGGIRFCHLTLCTHFIVR